MVYYIPGLIVIFYEIIKQKMKGTSMVYGVKTWESLIEEDIYNEIQENKIIKKPEYEYIEI